MSAVVVEGQSGPTASQRERERIAALPIRRRIEPVSWIGLIIGIFVILAAIEFLLSPGWQWDVVAQNMFTPETLYGASNALQLTVICLVLGLAVGVVLCAMRLSRFAALRAIAFGYIWVVRALPIMVMLLFAFFLGALVPTLDFGIPGLPPLFSVDTTSVMSRWGAAIAVLSLYLGGKCGEIFRGGYIGVPHGQHEASFALGLRPWTTLFRVTGPQAIRVSTPALANEIVTGFKNVSIVTVIGFPELLTAVQKVYSYTGQTMPLLAVACIWYFGVTTILMIGQVLLERRLGRGFRR